MQVMRTEILPARYGRAMRLSAGQSVEVVNLHGSQVVDSWAFAVSDPAEYLAMDQTRSVNSTIFVRRGMRLVSNRRRAMLNLAEDTSPGIHDTLLCACNSAIYRELGCAPDHRSCEQNLHEALAAIGMSVPFTPAPFNLFMNVPVAGDGTLDRVPPQCRPGDRVRLQAEMDLVVVFSACPQDVTPINGAARMPTDIELRLLSA
jgi:uncharacterized protein YcgI (DUF1989 family)